MADKKELTTKQKIYDTAKKLFFTKGYQVSFPRIAQEIGISQGLITYHFKTKRNIAIEIYKEDYQILSNYLKYVVNPDEDIFLFVVSFYYLNDRISGANPEKLAFLIQTGDENLSCEAIYASHFKQIYLKLMEKMKPNEYSVEENLTLFLTTTYSVYGALLRKQHEGLNISSDYFFTYTIDLMYHCLGYNRDDNRTADIIKKAKERVDLLLMTYPHLLDIHQYFLD